MPIPPAPVRGTSILDSSAPPKQPGFVSGASPSKEMHPLPPLHSLDTSSIAALSKDVLDQFEYIRRATLASRQNPFTAPSISRNITTTASPAAPQFVFVPHALGRPFSDVTVCKAQGAPWNGHQVQTGSVGFIQVNGGGSGYTSPPEVVVAGGGGSGAAGTAVIANGKVVSVQLTSGGSGHTGTPNVTLKGGGGSGAQAAAMMPPPFDPSTHSLHVATTSGVFSFHHTAD